MYKKFFGLRELPFNNTPDPRYFYSTPDHEEALASLIYAVDQRKGFVLLTGEVGAGKTLVSRMMLRHFGADIAFANINHATEGACDLMESLCAEFEIEHHPEASNAQMVRALHDFLLTRFSRDTPAVLILDEAQSLSVEAFEQLRMIGNLEADDAKLLQIVILGQPELRQRFASPQLRQLRQRIFRNFHLPRLNRTLTEGYIRHRLTIGGATSTDIFDQAAIDLIHEHAHGLPRLINAACDNAMLSAYSADVRFIDRPFVESVIRQMMTIDAEAEEVAARSVPPERPSNVDRVSPERAPARVSDRRITAPESFRGPVTHRTEDGVRDGATEWARTVEPLRRTMTTIERQEQLVAARVEGLAGRLTDDEVRLARVRGDCQAVLSDATAVLERVMEAIRAGGAVEQRVKTSHHDLLRQAQRTGRLTVVLRQILDRTEQQVERMQKLVAGSIVPKPALVITGENQEATTPVTETNASFDDMIEASRRQLCEVRSLIGETSRLTADNPTTEAPASEQEPQAAHPAGRLARKVQSLLEFIESGSAPKTQQAVPA